MHNRCRALAVVSALVVSLTAGGSAFAQQKGGKVDKAQQAEIAAATKIVDDALNGRPTPTDYKFIFTGHPMKGPATKTYLPFILSFEKGQALPPSSIYYVRVVSKENLDKAKKASADHEAAIQKAAMAAKLDPENTELADAEEKLRNETPKIEYAFEDFKTVNFNNQKPDTLFMLPSSMVVAPGEYDAYLLVKESQASLKNKKVPAKAGLLKMALKVPNYSTDELAISSLLLSKSVQAVKAGTPEADPARNPYVFGSLLIAPSLDFKFAKADELAVFFFIYNAGVDQAGKPNVTIDYSFYQKVESGEKYFNKTEALALNAATLPQGFDAKAGHQLPSLQTLPGGIFPEGAYRLEIKILDKVTGKTKTESVHFTVTP